MKNKKLIYLTVILSILILITGIPFIKINAAEKTSRTIRVAAIQMQGEPGGLAVNEKKAEKLIRKAAVRGAKYILFPELYALFPEYMTDITDEKARSLAQTVPGSLTNHMTSIAKELDVNIAIGMAEKRGEKFYNSLVFIEPEGVTGTYSKLALVSHESLKAWVEDNHGGPVDDFQPPPGPEEAAFFTPGDGTAVFNWGNVKTGALICADGSFEGLWANLKQNRVELICWSAANLGKNSINDPVPKGKVPGRHVPYIFANHMKAEMFFIGNSMIVDAEDSILAQAGPNADEIIVVDLHLIPTE